MARQRVGNHGDADRIGAMDERSTFMTRIRFWHPAATCGEPWSEIGTDRTVSTTRMVGVLDRV